MSLGNKPFILNGANISCRQKAINCVCVLSFICKEIASALTESVVLNIMWNDNCGLGGLLTLCAPSRVLRISD